MSEGEECFLAVGGFTGDRRGTRSSLIIRDDHLLQVVEWTEQDAAENTYTQFSRHPEAE